MSGHGALHPKGRQAALHHVQSRDLESLPEDDAAQDSGKTLLTILTELRSLSADVKALMVNISSNAITAETVFSANHHGISPDDDEEAKFQSKGSHRPPEPHVISRIVDSKGLHRSNNEAVVDTAASLITHQQTESHPDGKARRPTINRMKTIMQDQSISNRLALVRKANMGSDVHMHTDSANPGIHLRRRRWRTCEWIVKPTSVQRLIFDLINLVVVAYDLVTTPVAMAFDDVVGNVYFLIGQWLTLFFWTASLVMNFRAGYYTKYGDVELRPRAVARKYFRSWLVPDLVTLAVDWLDVVMYILDAGENNVFFGARLLRLPKVARLLRIIRVLRMARFTDVLIRVSEQCLSSSVRSVIETLGFLFVLVWANHCLACAWVSLGWYGVTDTGIRWIDTLGEDHISDFYLYSSALHWAMSQMTPGSMQVNAVNSGERWFTVFCLVLGLLFTGSIISSLSSKMTQLRMANQEKYQKLITMRKFLREKNISTETALSVQKQVLTRLTEPKPLGMADVPAVNMLSQSLRMRLQEEICKPPLLRYLFFRLAHQLDKTILRTLCAKGIEINFVTARDMLFNVDGEARSAWVLLHGCMTYRYASSSPVADWELAEDGTGTALSFQAGEEDSELEVLPGRFIAEPALWVKWHHRGNMEAQQTSEVLELIAHDIMKAIHRHYVVSVMAEEYRNCFCARLAFRSHGMDDPNDVFVPMATYHDIVHSMTLESRTLVGLAALEAVKQSSYAALEAVKQTSLYFGIGAKDTAKLEAEIRAGRKVLITTTDDAGNEQVECVASDVVFKLVEESEGKLLVQLGTVHDGGTVVAGCRLPSVVVEAGETSERAMSLMLASHYHSLEGLFRTGAVEQRTEVRESEFSDIRTRWLHTTFNAKLSAAEARQLPVTELQLKLEVQRMNSPDSGREFSMYMSAQSAPTSSNSPGLLSPARGSGAGRMTRSRSFNVIQGFQALSTGLNSAGDKKDSGSSVVGSALQVPPGFEDIQPFMLPSKDKPVPILAFLNEADLEKHSSPQGEASLKTFLQALNVNIDLPSQVVWSM